MRQHTLQLGVFYDESGAELRVAEVRIQLYKELDITARSQSNLRELMLLGYATWAPRHTWRLFLQRGTVQDRGTAVVEGRT